MRNLAMRDPKGILIAASVFGAPFLIMQIVAAVAGRSAASADAPNVAVHDAAPLSAAAVRDAPAASPEQDTARRRAEGLRSRKGLATPFDHDVIDAVPAPERIAEAPPLPPPPDVALQAVMGGRAVKAMIDGRLYGVGDVLHGAASWTIRSIDVEARRVTIQEASTGREATVSARQ